MSGDQLKNKLWLTIEVPGIYCDDFAQAAEYGFTPLDCLFDSMSDQVTLTIQIQEPTSGTWELMAYNAKVVDAQAEPIQKARES